MTETLINNFIIVAKEKSISKAAEVLFISPPAVSKQLSSFEKELGVVCFERTSSGLVLTPGGKLLLEFFEGYFLERKFAVEKAKVANHAGNRVFRVGVREDWNIADVLPEALIDFKKAIPGVEVALNIFRDDELVGGLISKKLDLIIATRNCILRNKKSAYYHIKKISRGALLAADHPLASKGDLNLGDLRDETFFLIHKADEPEGKSGALELLKQECAQYNFEPNVKFLPSLMSVYALVLDRRGVVLVSDWSIQRYNSSYKYIPFNNCDIEIGASWLIDEDESIKRAFYNYLLKTNI